MVTTERIDIAVFSIFSSTRLADGVLARYSRRLFMLSDSRVLRNFSILRSGSTDMRMARSAKMVRELETQNGSDSPSTGIMLMAMLS
ncbi:hypothetical protein D3C80_1245660 [compost metagenome]